MFRILLDARLVSYLSGIHLSDLGDQNQGLIDIRTSIISEPHKCPNFISITNKIIVFSQFPYVEEIFPMFTIDNSLAEHAESQS